MIQNNQLLTRAVEQVLPSKESLEKLMSQRPIKVYLGIDPTGSLLTLGHSIVLRKLQAFANAGHEAILLIGNGTVMIGDPTGKDTTRPELTVAQIEANFKDWQVQASKILDFKKIKIVRNYDWLSKLTYADMIKLLAKTTVQQLLERDMFQERLKANRPIHGHEIIYPLIQGFDSVELEVDLELGGTDQTFNMMMGRNLLKAYKNREKWVLTTPIINGTDGRKMSKSFNNFVALTDEPNDMYGKLMSITDEQIIPYFELLTDVPMAEIEAMKAEISGGENPMTFKKKLALEITKMYHSADQAQAAQENFEATVQSGQAVKELQVSQSKLSVLDLAKLAQPQESNSQLRRVIEQGGVQLDGEKLTDPYQEIKIRSGSQLKVGKRNLFKIKIKK